VPYPSLRRLQRIRAERDLEPPPYLLDVDAEAPQRTGRISARSKRRTDAQQFRAHAVQVQALCPQ